MPISIALETLKTPKTLGKFATALAGLMLWVSTVPALAQSGEFTYVIGSVTVERGAERIIPIRGTSVRPLDVIQTGPDGMAQLAMVDQAKLSLRSNSRLLLQQYPVSATDPPGAVLNLVSGTLRTFTSSLTNSNRAGYRMNTKIATIGIRGSGSILEHEGETTNHHTIEGSYIIASIDGNFPPIITFANQTVQVVPGQAPKVIATPPSLLDAGKVAVAGKEKKPEVEAKIETAAGPSAAITVGSTGTGAPAGTTGGQILGGNGLGFTIVDATGNLGADPINLQNIVIAAGGSTASDLAVPEGITLANGALRAYTAYVGGQSGTGANVVGGTARDVQTVSVGGNTTIVLGRWEGVSSYGFGTGNGGAGGNVGGSVHWAYGGAGFPSYLSDVLTGTATYTRQAATTPTNQFGTLGTLTAATLDVNFTARTLNAVIGIMMNAGSGVAAGSWNLAANNVPFSFNAFFASGSREIGRAHV